MATEQPALFWGIIASMWIGNLMLIVLNLPLIGLWVRLLTVPYYVLFPAIMAFCSIGVYSVNTNAFDLFAVAFFGLLGYVLVKLRCEPAPLLLGFVLGPLLEENLRRAMILSRGDPTTFLTRPISAALLASPSPCWSWSSCRRSQEARGGLRRGELTQPAANQSRRPYPTGGGWPSKVGRLASQQAQAGAMSVQITALGRTRLVSSSVPALRNTRCGRDSASLNRCVPHSGQKRRCIRLPLSARLAKSFRPPDTDSPCEGKQTLTAALPVAKYWQTRHQQSRDRIVSAGVS